MADVLQLAVAEEPTTKLLYGSYSAPNIVAGRKVRVNLTGPGVDILDQTVPAGKVWEVTVQVTIKETAA